MNAAGILGRFYINKISNDGIDKVRFTVIGLSEIYAIFSYLQSSNKFL